MSDGIRSISITVAMKSACSRAAAPGAASTQAEAPSARDRHHATRTNAATSASVAATVSASAWRCSSSIHGSVRPLPDARRCVRSELSDWFGGSFQNVAPCSSHVDRP